jgi:hypothetical protein
MTLSPQDIFKIVDNLKDNDFEVFVKGLKNRQLCVFEHICNKEIRNRLRRIEDVMP